MKTKCIDEETIIDFLEGRLSGRKLSKIEHHVSACPICLDQVAVYGAMIHGDILEDTEPVPEKVTRHAIETVRNIGKTPFTKAGEGYGERLSQKLKSALEKIRIGREPVPALVRNREAVDRDNFIIVRKTYSDLDLEIEFKKYREDRATIRIDLLQGYDLSKAPRVTLFKNKREMASSLLSNTAVMFEDIPYGIYVLVFSRNGEKIGEYPFEIGNDNMKNKEK